MTNSPTTPTGTTTRSSPPGQGGSGDQAKAEARNLAESGKQSAGKVAGEARSQASGLARTAREEARHRVDGEVGKLASFLDDIGDELDGMASGDTRTDGHLPALARDGAQMANRLSRRLETGGLDGALHDVSMFARRRPGVFLAAAFGVGLALGRVTRNADLHEISDEMKRGDRSDSEFDSEFDSPRATLGESRESVPQYRASSVSQPAGSSAPSGTSTSPGARRTP
jgi:hypothetical protein